MSQTVEQATKALWDYINSLPPDRREVAVAYQRKLELAAATTEGGMQVVIQQQLRHQTALLAETVDELQHLAAGYVASEAIRNIMKK